MNLCRRALLFLTGRTFLVQRGPYTGTPEAPLQGELSAKQTERLYEVRLDLLRQRRGKVFRLSGFFANKNRAAGNVRTCGAVYLLEEIVLVENGFLNPVGTIKIVYFIWRKKSTRVVKIRGTYSFTQNKTP